MSVFINEIQAATDHEWDELWQNCETSTYFHSREWAEIWSAYTKGRVEPAPKLVIFSDGVKVLLPLSSERIAKGMSRRFWSSPAGTFGGWLYSDSLDMDHTKLLFDFFTEGIGNLVWRLNPYDDLLATLPIRRKLDDETQVLDLTGSYDSKFSNWTKGHKSAARKAQKAQKAGVTVVRAFSIEDYESYYGLYEESLRRWGSKASSRYSWDLFREIYQAKSKDIILWLAVYEGSVTAGALCFYAKNHVVYWHGAASEKDFNLRPVNLLLSEVIKNACEAGYSWFDFNPSGGHEGVRAFKRSFGAQSKPSPVVVRRDWRLSIIEGLTKRLNV